MRNQFVFLPFLLGMCRKISQKSEFFEMLCAYALDEAELDLTGKKPAPATVFCAIRPSLERAHKRSKSIQTGNNL